jgi:hypothetical protein
MKTWQTTCHWEAQYQTPRVTREGSTEMIKKRRQMKQPWQIWYFLNNVIWKNARTLAQDKQEVEQWGDWEKKWLISMDKLGQEKRAASPGEIDIGFTIVKNCNTRTLKISEPLSMPSLHIRALSVSLGFSVSHCLFSSSFHYHAIGRLKGAWFLHLIHLFTNNFHIQFFSITNPKVPEAFCTLQAYPCPLNSGHWTSVIWVSSQGDPYHWRSGPLTILLWLATAFLLV